MLPNKLLPLLLIISFLSLLYILQGNAITVDVLNITSCRSSRFEMGTFLNDIESEETTDQLFNAEFHLPIDLDGGAMIEYESSGWENQQWKFLFEGIRSVCNSIVPTVVYRKFAKMVEPRFPEDCAIPAGYYKISKFPISGQYAALSVIQKAPKIVKHKIKLWVDNILILCRVVITEKNNY